MKDIDEPSTVFQLCTSILSKHLVIKLTTNSFASLIKEFKILIVKGHVMSLFFVLCNDLLPQTTNKILDYVGSLGGLSHKSSKSANEFKVCSSRIWEQMAHLAYKTLDDIRMAFL